MTMGFFDTIGSGRAKRISPSDAKAILEEKGKAVLVDVRTPSEHRQVRIPGSVLLPLDEIQVKAPRTLSDKAAMIIVYCASGARSASASRMLASMGYTDVNDLGGIMSWPYAIERG
jgi:rhodanese-related sulfurtransferase